LIEHPATKELTRKKGCTAAQVVYALAQSGGIVPLAGSTDLEHMKHGLDVEALSFSVPEEEKLISQLKAIVHLN
jgi:aryl-alcohol dehydrogenase-like predicted oxidoreductase